MEVLIFEVLVFEVLIYFRGLSFQATISGKSIGTLYVFPNGLYAGVIASPSPPQDNVEFHSSNLVAILQHCLGGKGGL